MRTRTYLILWIALAISVVLIVVLSSCSSDEEALPTSVDSTPTPVTSGFSTDVLRSPEFKDCIEELFVFAGHTHVYEDKTVMRDLAHQHKLAEQGVWQTDYSRPMLDETDTFRATGRGAAVFPYEEETGTSLSLYWFGYGEEESTLNGCKEIFRIDSAP